jgi:3'-phosphoadenosine 5'-phosphosulfate sulfotransferase (PAPS reductase)/FAD synthetase
VTELLDRIAGRRVVASISGGKDSAAMSLWLTEQGIEHDRVFLDTGWEHAATYEYLRGDLPRVIGPIAWTSSPRKMVRTILRKGMFPSRQRRFCTQELKVFPMQRFLAARMVEGVDVVNAVGIRAGESAARSKMPEWEWSDGFDCETWRPLLNWTEADVIAIHTRHGLRPNPLYLMGAERVGCWPCIYARKSEIRLVAEHDPDRVDLMERLEQRLSDRAGAPRAWFQDRMPVRQDDGTRPGGPWPIRTVIEWARTSRGGRQVELFAAPESDAGCMRWGLCETAPGDD